MLAMLLSTAVLLLTTALQPAAAARDQTPICDYYAKERFGENTKANQLRLMSSIVALAYAGGQNLTSMEDSHLNSGIFGVGAFKNKSVFLRPFFDGSNKTTNVNGHAGTVDWLDGGGVDPLRAFLNGTTTTAEIKNGTNQYTLFTHWYVAFGRIYSCSKAEEFLDEEYRTVMPAYVHRFMNLDAAKISYFIHQLGLASKFYGFSDTDVDTLEKFMNNKYNVRCAPAQNNSLPSICFNVTDCPVAVPQADCDAYIDIKQYGVDDNVPQQTPGATGTSAASPTGAAAGGKSDLGGGAIAGIVVGAIAGIGLIIGAVWFFFKKKAAAARPPESVAPSQGTSGYPNPSMYSPAMTQSHFDGSVSQQWDGGSQTHYDPSRQSQFTYFSHHDSHTGATGSPPSQGWATSSPPPQGWAELPVQELHANEMTSPPSSPTIGAAPGSQTKLGYKPDVREAVEMESPVPRVHGWAQEAAPEERDGGATAPNPEQNSDRR